jgi:putative component of toxin-antitoxin plasmid stabilization module
MEQGNLSNVKSVGEGVLEYKIDFGPGSILAETASNW